MTDDLWGRDVKLVAHILARFAGVRPEDVEPGEGSASAFERLSGEGQHAISSSCDLFFGPRKLLASMTIHPDAIFHAFGESMLAGFFLPALKLSNIDELYAAMDADEALAESVQEYVATEVWTAFLYVYATLPEKLEGAIDELWTEASLASYRQSYKSSPLPSDIAALVQKEEALRIAERIKSFSQRKRGRPSQNKITDQALVNAIRHFGPDKASATRIAKRLGVTSDDVYQFARRFGGYRKIKEKFKQDSDGGERLG